MEIPRIVFKVRSVLSRQLKPNSSYLLAVSGGADSLALADAAAAISAAGGLTFSVCHVEHGLRGEDALTDMRRVRKFCLDRGISCVVRHVDVSGYASRLHLSKEEAARDLRYQALREEAAKAGAAFIVTAHHLDDQAETVLLKLLRGASIEGLGAMSPASGDIVRPFLELEKRELEQYCRTRGISWCSDPTNEDTAYTRNRVRKELLPQLKSSFNPDISHALARTAGLLRQDADCLKQLATESYQKLSERQADGSIAFDSVALKQLHQAIASRVLRLAYFELGGKELDYERTKALEVMLERASGAKTLQLPGRIVAELKNRRLVFSRYE